MRRPNIFPRTIYCLLIVVSFLLLTVYCLPEIIDRIVAVVNEQVITLTDLRIAEAFGLYDEEFKERDGNSSLIILEKLIDQKLVIQLSPEEMSLKKEELDSFQKRIVEKIGSEEVKRRLEEFGLDWDELTGYIWEKVLYQKIISRKFGQRNIVSLKEIEDYYKKNYVPSQIEKGVEPQPMTELFDEIESFIIKEKIKTQVKDWINNLKKKADIQKLL